MKLESDEGIFLIPIGDKYAQFIFKPSKQMEMILGEYNIPYEKLQRPFKGDLIRYYKQPITKYKVIKCHKQPLTKYKVVCNTGEKPYYMFLFTADVIDKILNYYKINFEKEVM